jgi:uncharacterized protein YjbJ (UPF0337 family)
MSGTKDTVTGRIKEAAGVLTNNRALKREGQIDQAVGAVKTTVGKVVDKVRKSVSSSKKTAKRGARNLNSR